MVSDESRRRWASWCLLRGMWWWSCEPPRPAAALGWPRKWRHCWLLRGRLSVLPPPSLSAHRGAGGLLLAPPQHYDGSERRVGSVV